MFIKKFKFTDFNGVEREETHAFHIFESELVDLECSVTGGLTGLISEIIETKDSPKLIKLFKQFIDLSYGKRSADGRKFEKKTEYLEDFKSTQMYSDLYMELLSNAEFASEFINKVVPETIAAKAKTIAETNETNINN